MPLGKRRPRKASRASAGADSTVIFRSDRVSHGCWSWRRTSGNRWKPSSRRPRTHGNREHRKRCSDSTIRRLQHGNSDTSFFHSFLLSLKHARGRRSTLLRRSFFYDSLQHVMHIEVVITGTALRAHIGRTLAKIAKEFTANFAALAGRTSLSTTIRTTRHFGSFPRELPSFLFLKRARGRRSPLQRDPFKSIRGENGLNRTSRRDRNSYRRPGTVSGSTCNR